MIELPSGGPSSAETEVLETEERTLEPHEYRFINRWRLTGDVESVSAIIGDPKGYQHWWPSAWLDYKGIEDGDERGVGGVFRYKVKGWMPYTLNLTFHVKDVRTPNGYTVEATGRPVTPWSEGRPAGSKEGAGSAGR